MKQQTLALAMALSGWSGLSSCGVPCSDGPGGSVGRVGGADQAALSRHRQGSSSGCIERMLRIYFSSSGSICPIRRLKIRFTSRRRCALRRHDLGREPAPDETTVCSFAICLNAMNWGPPVCRSERPSGAAGLEDRHRHHRRRDHPARAVVDQEQERRARSGDAPVRKGKQWYFGMKAHVGVDAGTKLVHSVAATAANVADCRVLCRAAARRGDRGLGRSGLPGQTEVIRQRAPKAEDRTNKLWKTKLKVYLGPQGRKPDQGQDQVTRRTPLRAHEVEVPAFVKVRFAACKIFTGCKSPVRSSISAPHARS